ncbi:uncharacterized protein Z518_04127 [Rhinocladiella mackenziei CBS 650.93]|uniref:Bifunctional lycopene cyclase/phytoene synthase n=1 Tax=Rhinocladiella mackenziei CBS 650.93 TaxID=1442369 RepID=A0A0D2H6W7_9EURO|nr:uncharacterized protein Z518_04127 [Rhinocladiella mackenziei CBS 650.93]KIX06153.1 hypothetical protein Z518_04127 [Rhinocladiella mackenziei CBS 650.93]
MYEYVLVDSYLVRTRIWTYPQDAVLGPTLFDIPAEEMFFFLIQSYIATGLQILATKSVITATYLHNETDPRDLVGSSLGSWKCRGQGIFLLCSAVPIFVRARLIFGWASPVLLMLWTFAYQLLLTLPWTQTWLPIGLPTLYLWIVDTLALRRGTWHIESGTKLGIHVWPHLEIEEAVFFLITNILVVWGSVAFDNAIAILDAFPQEFPVNALTVLARKSRSFYLASGVFAGRLRIDLVLLYAFCRVADDLVDNAPSAEEADKWVKHFSNFLDTIYSPKRDEARLRHALAPFPSQVQSILVLLPADKLPSEPLYALLDGFRIDQEFFNKGSKTTTPIETYSDLERYASCVAGTVGLNLVYQHDPDRDTDIATKEKCLAAGARMGRALQYINIARDVRTDAETGRCYIPSEWLGRSPVTSVDARREAFATHRKRILDAAFTMYAENRNAIEELPRYARSGIRVAVESYMEIGRVMRERMEQGKPLDFIGGGKRGRTSVPPARRTLSPSLVPRGRGETERHEQAKKCRDCRSGSWKHRQCCETGQSGPPVPATVSIKAPLFFYCPTSSKKPSPTLGTSLEAEGVELVKCEPNYNVWFGDGECIELSTDIARMKKTIERYLAWMQEAHVHYEASVAHVLRKNFSSMWSMARPGFLSYLPVLHAFESIWTRAARYFMTERLRRAFTFGSMYMGMSPFETPGTYSLLQYTELAEGIWYPKGGFYKVLDALVKVGRTSWCRIQAQAASLSKKPTSCSSISFYWSVDQVIPELGTHNVFLADDYKSSFDEIFQRQQLPIEPSFHVNVPSRIDTSAAPTGRDSIIVLVSCGHLLEGGADRGLDSQDWPAMVSKARNTVLETVRQRTGVNLQSHVIHEIVNSPASWKEKFNLDKGAILGLSHSFFNVLSFRPATKHVHVGSLYFVGASTHPGTGVPIVLAGSKITAGQILDGLGLTIPWPQGGHQIRTVSGLDDRGKAPAGLNRALVLVLHVLLLLISAVVTRRHLYQSWILIVILSACVLIQIIERFDIDSYKL